MLFKLLGAPFTAPIAGFRFVLDQLVMMAEDELYDESRIREEFMLLQVELEEGTISEEEYVAREAEIMARLREARAYREAQARNAAGQSVDNDDDDNDTGAVVESWQ